MPQRSWYLLKQIGLRSVPQRLADKLELRQDEVADNEKKMIKTNTRECDAVSVLLDGHECIMVDMK